LLWCRFIDKDYFLRAIQLHIFDYGVPSLIVSDNGSPIVSGVEQTVKYLDDEECIKFLESHDIKHINFHLSGGVNGEASKEGTYL
jgi:hypothetical protein